MKRRLVGAVVLVSLAVIFLPMLLEETDRGEISIAETNIPPRPEPPQRFQSSVDPLPDDEPLIPGFRSTRAPEKERTPPVVGARPTPRVGLSAWVVQVASLSKPEGADRLQEDLRRKGYSAFIEQVEVKGKNLYRVRVGPEIDQTRAQATAAEIQREFELEGQVIRYP